MILYIYKIELVKKLLKTNNLIQHNNILISLNNNVYDIKNNKNDESILNKNSMNDTIINILFYIKEVKKNIKYIKHNEKILNGILDIQLFLLKIIQNIKKIMGLNKYVVNDTIIDKFKKTLKGFYKIMDKIILKLKKYDIKKFISKKNKLIKLDLSKKNLNNKKIIIKKIESLLSGSGEKTINKKLQKIGYALYYELLIIQKNLTNILSCTFIHFLKVSKKYIK
jgi:hypothetical protein